MSFFYRTVCAFLRVYFRLFYRLTVYGADHIQHGKAIVSPNHISFLDPPLIGAAWPEEVHFLARASLFRHYKLWTWVLSNLHAHPIQGNAQDIDSFRVICRLLDKGKKVVIFPEGERSPSGELQVIKSGVAVFALRTNSPIIPVYIQGTFEAWPRHRWLPKYGTVISCVIGKPIFPSKVVGDNKRETQELLTQQVQMSLQHLKNWLENGAQGEIP